MKFPGGIFWQIASLPIQVSWGGVWLVILDVGGTVAMVILVIILTS